MHIISLAENNQLQQARKTIIGNVELHIALDLLFNGGQCGGISLKRDDYH